MRIPPYHIGTAELTNMNVYYWLLPLNSTLRCRNKDGAEIFESVGNPSQQQNNTPWIIKEDQNHRQFTCKIYSSLTTGVSQP